MIFFVPGMEIPGWIVYAMWTVFKLGLPLFSVSIDRQRVYFQGWSISFELLKEEAGVSIDEDGGWSTSTGSYAYGYCPSLK